MGTSVCRYAGVSALMFVALAVPTGCAREAEQGPIGAFEDSQAVDVAPIVELRHTAPVRIGSPTPFLLSMHEPSGAATVLEEIGGEPVHVVAVKQDLSWFVHAHPRDAAPGRYGFDVTFPSAGSYLVYGVAAPAGRERQTLRTEVVVGAPRTPAPPDLRASPGIRRFGVYDVQLTTEPPTPVAGEWTTLRFHLRRRGVPVTDLRSDAGSGHLVILDSSATHFVYAHSTDGEALHGVRAKLHAPAAPPSVKRHEHAGDDRGPDVQFHALFPAPGLYKVWAELAPGQELLTADFVIKVGAGKVGTLQ